MLVRSLAALLIALMALSCTSAASQPAPKPTTSPPATPTSQPAPYPSTPSPSPISSFSTATLTPAPGGEASSQPTVPAEAAEPVRLAKQDLSQKQGMAVDKVQVVRVEAVDWPDASLGCPEPGQMYAQMITPGYRVLLAARGTTYEYHTDKDGTVVQCQKR